jgi:adenylosuccinate synthase
MPATVVVGTQWGDEGKGKITDQIAKEMAMVVRYQGGHNAGHTLVVNGERFALQLIPSGVLYDHVVPVIGNGVVVDPVTFLREVDGLTAKGIDCTRIRLSSRAHLILPWHQAHDAAAEIALGDAKLGTTLKGIGPAYADKARRVGLRVGDMLDRSNFAALLKARGEAENVVLAALGGDLVDVDAAVALYSGEIADRIAPFVCDSVSLIHEALDAGQQVLFEGAQATFLDLDQGTYPYVTSSNPVAGGACAGAGIGPRDITRVIGISKAYCTRVGSGPFPTEDHGTDGERLFEIGREFGTVTGRRRRTGWFDAAMLRHAARLNSLTELAITKLDVFDTFEEVKLCIGYERNGKHVKNYPDRLEELAEVRPVYETFTGWMTDLSSCRDAHELPSAAMTYLKALETAVGVAIRFVGTGPGRDQYVQFS